MPLSRQRIIDTARDEIERHGHEALSLRGLARVLDVTAPALYDHISSRDELVRCVAEDAYHRMSAVYDVEGERAIDRCRARGRAHVRFAHDHPELYRVQFLYRPAAVPSDHDNILAAANEHFEVGLDDLATAMRDGDLIAMDPARMSMCLLAALHGLATLAVSAPSLAALVEDDVIDAVYRGFAPPRD